MRDVLQLAALIQPCNISNIGNLQQVKGVIVRILCFILLTVGYSSTGWAEWSELKRGKCVSGDCKNGYGEIRYKGGDGYWYRGFFKNKLRHGEGTLYDAEDGPVLTGNWVKNELEGQGAMYFGYLVHEGEFRNSVPTGLGTRYNANGTISEHGIFKFGGLNGLGTRYNANGTISEHGIFKWGQLETPMLHPSLEEKGVVASGAGVTSEAREEPRQFSSSLGIALPQTNTGQQQTVQMTSQDQAGCVVGDCVNGKGTYYFANGNRYEGDWVDNKRTGKGTFYFARGGRYEGDWVDNKRTGKGTYYFKSGDRYEGDLVAGRYHGKGTLYFADGSINQQGIWKDGKLVQAMALNETPKPVQQQAPQIAADTQPPEITMQRGVNVVAKARHTVTGQAIDPSGVAIVEVNGKEASLDANGNFSANVLLVPGSNEITITAIDAFENTGYRTYSITREANAPAATPKATPQFTRTLTTGDYYALLIGVNEYESSSINDLVEPVKDSEKLGQILVDNYSFDAGNVSQLVNPTRDEILDELDRLAERLTQDDNLLIFYAGHGYWDETTNQGYWLPSDADQNRRRDWIPNGTIVDYINGIATQHTLLISDACFSGGIFKTRSAFNDIPPATEALYDLPSRKAMTSGTLTEVPDKSVFIEYLIKRLENNDNKYSTSQEIFASMRTAVINNSPTEQVPQFGEIRETGDEGGDFIFVRR